MNPDDDYFDDPRNGLPLQSEWPYNKWEQMDDLDREAWTVLVKQTAAFFGIIALIGIAIGLVWLIGEYGPDWFIRLLIIAGLAWGSVVLIREWKNDIKRGLEAKEAARPKPQVVTLPARPRKLTANLVDNREPVDYAEVQSTIDSMNKHQAEIDKIRKEAGVEPGEPLLGLDFQTAHSAHTAWVTKENPR